MFKATMAVLSKASRAPLTSKSGNKEFYKGTGSFPGLGPKRQGRHGTRSKAPYLLMPERMRTFVVPEGLNESELRPYVARTAKVDSKDAEWPVAHSKGNLQSKRGGIYGPNGFDGEYYIQLSQYLADKSKALKA
ncbi:hypothetical protein BCR35DRAFT_349092 [Leucosporidium creatinivorum]|uniref:Mitochondrial ribosomal protein L27-domain-containing protein n=1 Tax=Leucosporidium creatinivorum TaxID=106004 RepID=A0A1Y2G6T2_9BASI|nr:hypothetical protein BCR35DRAFT_349092 [Leucosporidium creatinivorum]